MSTEPHSSGQPTGRGPRHADVAFEERDIKPSTMYWYLLALGLATAGALLICIFVLRFTSNLAASSEAPPHPPEWHKARMLACPPDRGCKVFPGTPTNRRRTGGKNCRRIRPPTRGWNGSTKMPGSPRFPSKKR